MWIPRRALVRFCPLAHQISERTILCEPSSKRIPSFLPLHAPRQLCCGCVKTMIPVPSCTSNTSAGCLNEAKARAPASKHPSYCFTSWSKGHPFSSSHSMGGSDGDSDSTPQPPAAEVESWLEAPAVQTLSHSSGYKTKKISNLS